MYKYAQGTFNAAAGSPAGRINSAAGKLDTTVDTTANIRSVTSLTVYNGQLYLGSETNLAGKGAIYQYDPTNANLIRVTLLGSNKGVFGSDTGISAVDVMQEFNGTLYIGTDQASKGSVYTWSATQNNSYALKFDSGFTNGNYGAISFVGGVDAENNNNHTGTFLFSNSVALASGGFDYAEDYPTNDTSIIAGEIVAIDPQNSGYVKRADNTSSVIGVYSENPGFDLKQSPTQAGLSLTRLDGKRE